MLIKISNIPIQVNTHIKLANFDSFYTEELPLYIIDRGTSSTLIHQRYEKGQLMYELFFDGTLKYTYVIHSTDEHRRDEIEYVASLDLISLILMKNKHYIFHASAFVFEDHAVLLAGKSGVGKTTLSNRFSKEQTFKWINDDKPILHTSNHQLYVSSSPWMGKDQFGQNIKQIVETIYFLEQGNENEIIELSSIEKIVLLREHLIWSPDKTHIDQILLFIGHIIDHVNLYKMICTNTDKSYDTLKKHIYSTTKKK